MARFVVVRSDLGCSPREDDEYGILFEQAARASGLDVSILAQRRVTVETSAPARAMAAWEHDLVDGLLSAGVSSGDHVFFLDVSPVEIEHLIHALIFGRLPELPRFHLLIRRDAKEHSDREQLVLSELFRNFHTRTDLAGCLRFYTDTDERTHEHNHCYARFSGMEFATLPSSLAPATLIQTLIEDIPPAVRPEPRGRVLFIMECWTFLDALNGASHTVRGALEWLTSQGYEMDVVLVGARVLGPKHELTARNVLEPYSVRKLGYTSNLDTVGYPASWCHEGPWALDVFAVRIQEEAHYYTMRQQLRARELHHVPESLVETVRATRYAFAYVNYCTNIPVVERLGASGTPIFCETHDYLSRQFAISRGTEIDPEDDVIETRLLQQAACALFVNDTERLYFEPRLPRTKCVTVFKPAQVPDLVGAIAGCRTLVDVTAISQPPEDKIESVLIRAASLKQLDLLFVSSDHLPNVDSLNWFFRSVYEPYLERHGVSMVVAGAIGKARMLQPPRSPLVICTQRVERLEPLYAATRIVVVPIVRGAGLAIKTIEAIATGKPMVATPLAFRGLQAFSALWSSLVVDNAAGLATRILDLLSNIDVRRANATAVRDLAMQVLNQQPYRDGWTQAVRSIDAEFEPRPADNEDVRFPSSLVEFDEENSGFNQAALAALAGKRIPVELAQVVVAAAKDSVRRDLFRDMYGALVGGRAMMRRVFGDEHLGLQANVDLPFDSLLRRLDESAAPGEHARQLMVAGQVTEALQFCLSRLEQDAHQADLWLVVAAIMEALGDDAKALESLENAITLAPGSKDAQLAHARLRTRLGLPTPATSPR